MLSLRAAGGPMLDYRRWRLACRRRGTIAVLARDILKRMPIYEYKCAACGRLTSSLVRNIAAEVAPPCQHCGGRTARALSRFAYHKSEQRVLEEHGALPRTPEEYRDPRQIGRWVEKKFDDYGMDLPDEARTMIDAAREGEMPDAVKDL